MATHKMILQTGTFSLRLQDKDGQRKRITLKAGDAVDLTPEQCTAFADKFKAAEEVAAEAEVKAKIAAQKTKEPKESGKSD